MYRLNLRLIPPDNEDNPLSFRCPSPLDLKACSSEMEPSNWFLLVRSLASFWGLKKVNSSLRGKPVQNKFPVWFLVSCIRDTSWLKRKSGEKKQEKKRLLFFIIFLTKVKIGNFTKKKKTVLLMNITLLSIPICIFDIESTESLLFFSFLFNFFFFYLFLDWFKLEIWFKFLNTIRNLHYFLFFVEYWIKKS